MTHRIPDKLSRRSEREIADAIGFEDPGLFTGWLRAFVRLCLFRSDHKHGLLGCPRRCQTGLLLFGQNLGGIQQLTGRGDDMIVRDRDPDHIVSDLQGEFTSPKKLLVLPTLVVGVGNHSWEPVGHLIDVVPISLKELKSRSCADNARVIDVEFPTDLQFGSLTRFKRFRQIDAHHRFDHGVFQILVVAISNVFDIHATRKFFDDLHGLELIKTHSTRV